MAWDSVIENGDRVSTPEGMGTVRTVSGSGTAQVAVDGKSGYFEFPVSSLGKSGGTGGEQKGRPVRPWSVKKGDKVQKKDGSGKATVMDVTQRTVRVKYDANGKVGKFDKKTIGTEFDYQDGSREKQERQQQSKNFGDDSNYKVGDRVEHREFGKGTVKVANDGDDSLGIEFDEENAGLHTLKDRVKSGHGYWTSSNQLKKIDEEQEQQQEEEKKEEQRQEEREQRDPETKAKDTADDLYGLFNLKDKLEQKIEDSVDDELRDLREMVKSKATLEVKIGDKVNEVKGLKHKQLEQLIKYAALRLSPLLVGMAGTGKTHAGQQASEALGLQFYSISVGAQTTKTDIMGYMDATGRYIRTLFREAYENGGVFLMDEIDAGNANVLITINAALANGLAAFPDGMVKRHEDFVFIASANTFGNGANRQYVGRNQLDAATLDRFAMVEWHIDDDLEEGLAFGHNGKAWYMAVRAARDYVSDKNIRALISPRATQKGSKLLDVGIQVEEVIDATMLGSVPDDKKQDVKDVAVKVFEKFASEVGSKLSSEVNPPTAADLVKDLPF